MRSSGRLFSLGSSRVLVRRTAFRAHLELEVTYEPEGWGLGIHNGVISQISVDLEPRDVIHQIIRETHEPVCGFSRLPE